MNTIIEKELIYKSSKTRSDTWSGFVCYKIGKCGKTRFFHPDFVTTSLIFPLKMCII